MSGVLMSKQSSVIYNCLESGVLNEMLKLLNVTALTWRRYIPEDGIVPKVFGSGYSFWTSNIVLCASSGVRPPLLFKETFFLLPLPPLREGA